MSDLSPQPTYAAPHFDLDRLVPPMTDGSTIIVAVDPSDFLASRMARAVEDTDAHLLNLNVTAERTPHDELIVHLRVDRRNGDAVARSLERYGYRILSVENAATMGGPDLDDATRDRVNALLRYLEI